MSGRLGGTAWYTDLLHETKDPLAKDIVRTEEASTSSTQHGSLRHWRGSVIPNPVKEQERQERELIAAGPLDVSMVLCSWRIWACWVFYWSFLDACDGP